MRMGIAFGWGALKGAGLSVAGQMALSGDVDGWEVALSGLYSAGLQTIGESQKKIKRREVRDR
ncbi:MAG: hypothetical protein GY757_11320 [bacterium]|nr:hypothetical protein [bacterium]